MAVAVLDAPVDAELCIQPRMADVRLASEWLARSGAALAVPEENIGRLDLCLNEALANVIAHGGEGAAAQPLCLLLRVRTLQGGGEASLTVSDAGTAFDATAAPLAVPASSLADAMPGGLGLLMMRKFSDALVYQRKDDRNLLSITVRWA
ncbi:MAG: ATP-binding protein [Rhodoferax sp.]|nr:ATP-binding protein [Rhodoferax sp.]